MPGGIRSPSDGIPLEADEDFPELREPWALDYLSEFERKSIIDNVGEFVEFTKRRFVSLAADQAIPGIGGRAVDLAYQILDVVASVRALARDRPVLEVPLPFPIPGLSFSAEIPLDGGEAVAVCISPDTPSLTGGWALDAPEQNKVSEGGREEGHAPDQPQDDAAEEDWERSLQQHAATPSFLQPGEISGYARPPLSWGGPPVECVVQVNLKSLGFLKRRRLRAWELYVLATECAALFWENPVLRRFKVLLITDPGWRCGLWVRLDGHNETRVPILGISDTSSDPYDRRHRSRDLARSDDRLGRSRSTRRHSQRARKRAW